MVGASVQIAHQTDFKPESRSKNDKESVLSLSNIDSLNQKSVDGSSRERRSLSSISSVSSTELGSSSPARKRLRSSTFLRSRSRSQSRSPYR